VSTLQAGGRRFDPGWLHLQGLPADSIFLDSLAHHRGSSRKRRRVHLGCSRSATAHDPRPSWAPALISDPRQPWLLPAERRQEGHFACWPLKRHCGRCPRMAVSGGQQPTRARRWLLATPGSLADRQQGLMRASGESQARSSLCCRPASMSVGVSRRAPSLASESALPPTRRTAWAV
jgi:hypothetical protein